MLTPYNRNRNIARPIAPAKAVAGSLAAAGATLLAQAGKNLVSGSGKKKNSKKKSNDVAVIVSSSKGKYIKPKKRLKDQVKDLKRLANVDMGELIYRDRTTGRLLAAINSQNMSSVSHYSTSTLEAVLGQLRYYDPSTPGTLIQASGATGSYKKDFMFKSLYANMCIRNNYQSPVKLSVYVVQPKTDTSIDSVTAFTNGLTDVGAPSSTSPMVFLTDSEQFKDLWKIVNSKNYNLRPGEMINYISSVKDIIYDPSLSDSQTESFQKKSKCRQFILRVEGIIAHDTSADQQGHISGGIDYSMDRTFKVVYDAGVDLKYIYLNDNLDTFTNGGVVTCQPVADNIGYSVS